MSALHAILAALALSTESRASKPGMPMSSKKSEYYTQNAICLQNNCVNPIFPGLDDLAQLNQVVWQCTTHDQVGVYLDFCREAVNYNPSLPSPNATSQPIDQLVKQQDDAATTMYFYHLNGIGYEASEHRSPATDEDQCVRAIWKLVCYTYFPKVQAGCEPGQPSPYLRPCRNSCESYIESCQVECCDESVQCTFTHMVEQPGTDAEVVEVGYADLMGPAAKCTGSDGRGLKAPFSLLFGILAVHMAAWGGGGDSTEGRRQPGRHWLQKGMLVAVLVAMLSLQGCEVDLPYHKVGNWEAQRNYLVSYEFVPPKQLPSAAILNSCNVHGLSPALQCSGRGYCVGFSPKDVVTKNAVSFCQCDHNWADPECRTRRKSQLTLFLLSLFGGFFGLDWFYLDYPFFGCCKLCTFGGCGVWWLIDVMRTGSGAVYAWRFRVANDLPHWVFVLSVVTLFGFAGFALGIESYLTYRRNKREEVMKLQESEEARQLGKMEDIDGPRYKLGVTGAFDRFRHTGYGSTLQTPAMSYGGAPMAGPKISQWSHNVEL